MALEPPKKAAGVQYEPRSGGPGYPDTPTSPQEQQTPSSVKKHAGEGVKRIVRELRVAHPQIQDKVLRDSLHKAVKAAIPLRRGRREDPRIARGVELYLSGTPMEKVLRDPEVLGARPPGGPADLEVWRWDKAAESTRKSIFRAARRRPKSVRRQRTNRSRKSATETCTK